MIVVQLRVQDRKPAADAKRCTRELGIPACAEFEHKQRTAVYRIKWWVLNNNTIKIMIIYNINK